MEQLSHQNLIETASTADSTDAQNHDDLLQISTQEEYKELPEKITNEIETQKDPIPDPEPINYFADGNKTIENLQPEVENAENQSCQVETISFNDTITVEDFEEFNDKHKENMLTFKGVDRQITPYKTRQSVLAAFDPLYVTSPAETPQKEETSTSYEMADNTSFTEDKRAQIRLQLNASQQARATLELELKQKEEIYIKSQAEWSQNEQMYLQDIKKLQEKLEQKVVEKIIEPDQDRLELVEENNRKLTTKQSVYEILISDYEKFIAAQSTGYNKLKGEHETVKRHLANLELAFSDIHQKYERSKTIIVGYKENEEALSRVLMVSQTDIQKSDEKYEALKSHARAVLENANKETVHLQDKYELEIQKLVTLIKRLEIKSASLTTSLQQKTEECCALAALCDEVTGKV